MYKVIGGDGRQYGPITDLEMRQWIGEGRLNAQSLARAEGDAEFRPLSTFPEFADALGSAAPISEGPASHAPAVDWSDRDYELDIGGCVSQGWNLTITHFGQLFVPVLIYLLIEVIIGMLGKIPVVGPLFSLANLFICGQLMAGVFYVFILTIRGKPADVGIMFEGFRRNYWQLFLGYLIPALFNLLCMAPFLIVWVIKLMSVMPQFRAMNPAEMPSNFPAMMAKLEPAIMVCLPVFLICLIPAIYLTVNWQFTLPLIIDRQLRFWPAMTTSWKMVHKHWWTVFGLFVVIALINLGGLLLCCIGLAFTLPLTFAALMFAYETIFGQERASSNL